MSNATIALVANSSWYLWNFRLSLAERARDEGHEIILIAPRDVYTDLLLSRGFSYVEWKVNRASISPYSEIASVVGLSGIYKAHNICIVHHFTIKACIYGTIAAKISRIKRVVNSITGLGHVVVSVRRRTRFLRYLLYPLYVMTLNARRASVVLQNKSDLQYLKRKRILLRQNFCLIEGSGTNPDIYKRKSNINNLDWGRLIVLFPARLVKEKGIIEAIRGVEGARDKGLDVRLRIAGDCTVGNRSVLSAQEILELQNKDYISFLGHVEDLRDEYERANVVLLPSWREGLSKTLVEAAFMEVPLITTDVAGCSDIVETGRSGFLVPVRDPLAITLALVTIFNSHSHAIKLGKQARLDGIRRFNTEKITKETLALYNKLLGNPARG